jgi:heptosyltransferase-3
LNPFADRPPASILIGCIRLIGDVILATPLVGLFRETWPDAAIDVLVARGTGEFLEKDPRIRRVIYAGSGKTAGSGKGDAGYARRIFRAYDLSVSLTSTDRGTLAAAIAGRRARVGFTQGGRGVRDAWKKVVLTHPIPNRYAIHVARVCQLVGEALGLSVSRLESKVFWDAADAAAVDVVLRDGGIDRPFFVVHPFARWRYKYWEPERFAEASDAVAERYGLAPVWTSSPDPAERALLRETAARCRVRPALVEGALSLNGMTCLLSRASLYLGLDTAISHLAATTGIPMVVLYGPTIAERWSPWNNAGPVAQQFPEPRGVQRSGNTILVQKGWACVPCGKAGCDDQGGPSRCMAEIETEGLLQAVESLLGATGDAKESP